MIFAAVRTFKSVFPVWRSADIQPAAQGTDFNSFNLCGIFNDGIGNISSVFLGILRKRQFQRPIRIFEGKQFQIPDTVGKRQSINGILHGFSGFLKCRDRLISYINNTARKRSCHYKKHSSRNNGNSAF